MDSSFGNHRPHHRRSRNPQTGTGTHNYTPIDKLQSLTPVRLQVVQELPTQTPLLISRARWRIGEGRVHQGETSPRPCKREQVANPESRIPAQWVHPEQTEEEPRRRPPPQRWSWKSRLKTLPSSRMVVDEILWTVGQGRQGKWWGKRTSRAYLAYFSAGQGIYIYINLTK